MAPCHALALADKVADGISIVAEVGPCDWFSLTIMPHNSYTIINLITSSYGMNGK